MTYLIPRAHAVHGSTKFSKVLATSHVPVSSGVFHNPWYIPPCLALPNKSSMSCNNCCVPQCYMPQSSFFPLCPTNCNFFPLCPTIPINSTMSCSSWHIPLCPTSTECLKGGTGMLFQKIRSVMCNCESLTINF